MGAPRSRSRWVARSEPVLHLEQRLIEVIAIRISTRGLQWLQCQAAGPAGAEADARRRRCLDRKWISSWGGSLPAHLIGGAEFKAFQYAAGNERTPVRDPT